MLLMLLACGPDTSLNKAQPHAVADPDTVDFDEVVIGTTETFELTIKNEGSGFLEVLGATLSSDSSSDYALVSYPGTIRAGESDIVTLSYSPGLEGGDIGVLQLTTNEDEAPLLEVPLSGTGTKPILDLDPELLTYVDVAPGDSSVKSVQVGATGSGALTISDIRFGDDADGYTVTYDSSIVLPYTLAHGSSFSVDVTFAPEDEVGHESELWISSDDPESPVGIVRLLGNVGEDPQGDDPPEVEVQSPNNGAFLMDDELATLVGSVYDPNEAATTLLCGWYSDGSLVANASVAADGTVTGSGYLPIGDVDVTLRCVDSTSLSGSDSSSVTVWDHEEPVLYVISGGSSLFDYWSVDDDVSIIVNGAPVFQDVNHTQDEHGPVQFEATKGDVIEIVATDQNPTIKALGALTLHWGTEASQTLDTEVCDSSYSGDACYTGAYSGPWPNTFFDETFTINIP